MTENGTWVPRLAAMSLALIHPQQEIFSRMGVNIGDVTP